MRASARGLPTGGGPSAQQGGPAAGEAAGRPMFHVKHAGRPRHAGPACRGAPEGASRGGESLAENGAGPPVASSAAAYALGIRDATCELAASRSPDGWPPVHEQHWRGRTTKVRMSGRIAQTMVARHPLPLPESERFTRHPSPLATPLRREGASSTEGGASEAREKGRKQSCLGKGGGGGWTREGRSGSGRARDEEGTRRPRGWEGREANGGVGTQAELPGQGRGVAGSAGGRMGARGGVVGRRVGRGEPQGGRRGRRGAGQRSRAGAAQAAVARHPPPRGNASQEKGPHGAPRRRRTRLPAQREERERKERAGCRNGEADGKTAFRLVTHQPHAAGVCEHRRTEIS